MKLDVTQVLKNLDDVSMIEKYVDSKGDQQERDLTLKNALTNAVLANTPQAKNDDGKAKYKKFELAGKINASDEPAFISEELSELKRLVGECYGVVIVGRIWDLIESKKE